MVNIKTKTYNLMDLNAIMVHINEIIKQYQDGKSIEYLAVKYEVSRMVIYKILAENNISL